MNDMTYIDGVPTFGRCSKCGRPFTTPANAMAEPEQATRDFYTVVENHKCDVDASQAAVRIVKEATISD